MSEARAHPSRTLAPTDPSLHWAGSLDVEIVEADGAVVGACAWRVPFHERKLFPGVSERASHAAGVRIRFATDATALRLRFELTDCDNDFRPVDVVVDAEVVASVASEELAPLPTGGRVKTVELWLPQFGRCVVRGINLFGGTTVEPTPPETGPRWTTYGSSITQARQAHTPTRCWPAQVARSAGLTLTCLGYGGQCHLDPLLAQVVADVPADIITICAGINIYGANSLGRRAFLPALLGTARTVRRSQPEVPIALISPIYSPPREEVPNRIDFTLKEMRDEVRRAVDLLREHGDEHLTYIDGLSIFGEEHASLMPDELHPNDAGQDVITGNMRPVVERLLRQ